MALALALVAGGWFVQRDYLQDRYDELRADAARGPLGRRHGGRADRDRRLLHPVPALWADLSNRVDYVAKHGPHGAFTRIRELPRMAAGR